MRQTFGTDRGSLGGPTDEPPIELRVSDIKQWFYCQRVVYWTRVASLERPLTPKMGYGKEAHDLLDRLERRRTFRQYGIAEARRRFHFRLRSESLGLSGMLDLCLETPEGLFPVEFKDSLRGLRQNHTAQLAAYALLLEDARGLPVRHGFWISIPQDQVRTVPLTRAWKDRVRSSLQDIRDTIQSERLPAPADRWEKCRDCEFLRFCGDRYRQSDLE